MTLFPKLKWLKKLPNVYYINFHRVQGSFRPCKSQMLLHNNKVWNIVTEYPNNLCFFTFLQNHNFANLWFSIKSFPSKTCFRHLKLIGLLCKSKWKMYWKSFLRWQKHLWSESTTILLLRKRHIEYWKLMPGIAAGYNLFIEKIRMVTWIFYPSYTSLF